MEPLLVQYDYRTPTLLPYGMESAKLMRMRWLLALLFR